MTIEEVKTVIFRYIFGYCNTQRVNSFDLDGLHRWFTESRRHSSKQLHKPTATLYILSKKCCKGFTEDNRNSKYASVNFGCFLTAHLLTVPDMISTPLLICINQGQPKNSTPTAPLENPSKAQNHASKRSTELFTH